MKSTLRPQNALFLLLLSATLVGRPAAAAPATTHPTVMFTAFEEGMADGKAYRVSVKRVFNGTDLIAQQVQAAQNAAAANPSLAPYFQGYVAGLQPDTELTTMANSWTR